MKTQPKQTLQKLNPLPVPQEAKQSVQETLQNPQTKVVNQKPIPIQQNKQILKPQLQKLNQQPVPQEAEQAAKKVQQQHPQSKVVNQKPKEPLKNPQQQPLANNNTAATIGKAQSQQSSITKFVWVCSKSAEVVSFTSITSGRNCWSSVQVSTPT